MTVLSRKLGRDGQAEDDSEYECERFHGIDDLFSAQRINYFYKYSVFSRIESLFLRGVCVILVNSCLKGCPGYYGMQCPQNW